MPTEAGTRVATIELAYAPPYDWSAMMDFLAARAIPGVEVVDGRQYTRSFAIDGRAGTVRVTPEPRRSVLVATISGARGSTVAAVERRLRRVFDLDVDLRHIEAHLRRSALLAPLIAARPGLRTAGAWDGFELGVRAMLGQQISVVGARQLAGRLAAKFGEPLSVPGHPHLSRVFPAPDVLAGADIAALGMPRARARAISGLAAANLADPNLFERSGSLAESVERLKTLAGIGEWTAQYIALRALRDPDAFPAADVGLLKAATPGGMTRLSSRELLDMAEDWRPWRAYAAQHLWTSMSGPQTNSRRSR